MQSTDLPEPSAEPPDPLAAAVVFVLGGGPVGVAVARRLRRDHDRVVHVDESIEAPDAQNYRGDPTNALALEAAGLHQDAVVIVASSSDSRNLLAAQLARVRFGVVRVVVLTNRPELVDVMADAGIDPVCATAALADRLVEQL